MESLTAQRSLLLSAQTHTPCKSTIDTCCLFTWNDRISLTRARDCGNSDLLFIVSKIHAVREHCCIIFLCAIEVFYFLKYCVSVHYI